MVQAYIWHSFDSIKLCLLKIRVIMAPLDFDDKLIKEISEGMNDGIVVLEADIDIV